MRDPNRYYVDPGPPPPPSTDALTERLVGEWLAGREQEMRDILARSESPIERAFVASMMVDGWHAESVESAYSDRSAWDRFVLTRAHGQLDPDGPAAHGTAWFLVNHCWYDAMMLIQPSLLLGDRRMRLDLAIVGTVGPYTTMVAVELDGHDFHERTKEQARRDKSRDRILQLHGWRVLRFTGSEVFKDVGACIRETEDVFMADGDAAIRAREGGR